MLWAFRQNVSRVHGRCGGDTPGRAIKRSRCSFVVLRTVLRTRRVGSRLRRSGDRTKGRYLSPIVDRNRRHSRKAANARCTWATASAMIQSSFFVARPRGSVGLAPHFKTVRRSRSEFAGYLTIF